MACLIQLTVLSLYMALLAFLQLTKLLELLSELSWVHEVRICKVVVDTHVFKVLI